MFVLLVHYLPMYVLEYLRNSNSKLQHPRAGGMYKISVISLIVASWEKLLISLTFVLTEDKVIGVRA